MAQSGSGSLILLTGATGYVGGRLLSRLLRAGHRVRCMARRPEHLRPRLDASVELVAGDVMQPQTLDPALRGVDTAYYLIHSMSAAGDFPEADRQAAGHFGSAAARCGLRRIIYLGGLADSQAPLSAHLQSRQEVGRILRASGVEVIELRASIVIGSGSLSFEMVRALVERLPIMITPRWVSEVAQPIAIQDLLDYLTAALELPPAASRIFEIGGADQVSYGGLMREYARQRGLRRLMIPVPVLTPRLSSLWLGLVTPLYARVGRILIDSIRCPSVVRDRSALEVFALRPMGVRDAIASALRQEDQEYAETRWSDALSLTGPQREWAGVRFGTRLIDSRTARLAASPPQAFAPIRRIGGCNGWYNADWLWALRGFLDLLVGGIGMRRGRRHPDRLQIGDVIDFWRVEAFEPDRRLRLFAEMKLPGRAWLEFEVEAVPGGSQIRQTAEFDPVGLGGQLYWYGLYPAHQLVFAGMLRGIVAAARRP